MDGNEWINREDCECIICHHFSLSELYIFEIWNDNLQSFNRDKMKHRYQSFTRTSVPVPRTSSLCGLDVGFIPLLPKELPYMTNNDEYTDEYNDEYLCRDFFVGFNFWSRQRVGTLPKSRYYKERQVDRKKRQAIRW